MPKEEEKKEEESELEEEVIKEIDSEKLKEQIEELQQDFNEEGFHEFLHSSGRIVAPVLDQVNPPQQTASLEQDMSMVPTSEETKEQKGYIERLEDTGIDYATQEPKNLESARKVPMITTDLNQGPMPLRRHQKLTAETELDQMRNPQQEKGEYMVDVENIEMDRHAHFEDPKKRYKERQIR